MRLASGESKLVAKLDRFMVKVLDGDLFDVEKRQTFVSSNVVKLQTMSVHIVEPDLSPVSVKHMLMPSRLGFQQ